MACDTGQTLLYNNIVESMEIRTQFIEIFILTLLGQTKLMSWSSDFPTLIIQNQNFNKKNISDDQSQKCSCPTTCSFFFT